MPRPRGTTGKARLHDWAELLRLPALFTVPGDALAGAAALTAHPDHRTLLAIGSSLCLYEAGMALNDWADRAEDAVERPHRPLPSGRVGPTAAFTAACAFTAAGLALAARAGRPALTVAAPLAATVWAYDLALKHTPAGSFAMRRAGGPGHGRRGRRPAYIPPARLTVPLATALAAAYALSTARPYLHAALNPSPPLTQRAVSAGIRATIPLQAALAARSGATVTPLLTVALVPVARRLARRVSIT
ncbi:UbiA family prenyltransferase [Streptomyces sp. NBC_01275]|uniref:UbiA family prenyltransferase n=1 Tax=Streptomyces sp. NBC_01275 TaxID=2903807 RepID=UPI00225A9AC3|nr:UbiA family prenyltransferase [Streptomyces sp. NBC_01275]MCX4766257.1 UbiA family prenyltransferase [Streptomyces sp. NBC_01275]